VMGITSPPAHVVVSTHSGGYRAAAAAALVGWNLNPSPVRELWLLDSLYAGRARLPHSNANAWNMYSNQTDFEAWVQKQLPALCDPPYPSRFASIYTDNGGTLQLNQRTADAVASWPAVDKRCLLDDRSTDTLTPQQYGPSVHFAAN
jgi:hypothetical protein